MNNCMKNLAFDTVLSLAEQVDIQTGQVVSKTLAQIPHAVFAKEAFKMLLVVVFPLKGGK